MSQTPPAKPAQHRSYKDESRDRNWGTTEPGTTLTLDQIKLGCMLRIADATEAMAKNHVQLQNERDYLNRALGVAIKENSEKNKTIASLKGQITKLKNKLKP